MTVYFSLPVHEAPLVVADQLTNFSRYAPQARVVLHVSSNAAIDVAALHDILRRAGNDNYLINPVRERTAWGGILRAHLANIAFIRALGDASHICFHASNDMLIRPGCLSHITAQDRAFNVRPIFPESYWWVARKAFYDPALRTVQKRLGGCALFGSQIEGAFYDAPTLFEIADILRQEALATADYPQEEVVFATVAKALGATPNAMPYVFSEAHVFDRAYWRFLQQFEWMFGNNWTRAPGLRYCVEYAFIKTPFYRLRPDLVELIARPVHATSKNGRAFAGRSAQARRLGDLEWMDDGNSIWRVFSVDTLYGVKRVPRSLDNPLRRFIQQLPTGTLRPTQDREA
ncbi:hypothetical protein [Paraburkholderia kirstenboschensis]|uniref:Uncharacterized protein n=1 Tax=Paraburkholderia kirstenboschensis TaxID=1245436 RepID=A0ABZ0E9V5_9BURK|nr:hypothetical protein [Paraburkholderia kirstenboschensis]WOD14036.1 hypothetical protein RW095_00425 [Paraburkholderia kirstenboschensis]